MKSVLASQKWRPRVASLLWAFFSLKYLLSPSLSCRRSVLLLGALQTFDLHGSRDDGTEVRRALTQKNLRAKRNESYLFGQTMWCPSAVWQSHNIMCAEHPLRERPEHLPLYFWRSSREFLHTQMWEMPFRPGAQRPFSPVINSFYFGSKDTISLGESPVMSTLFNSHFEVWCHWIVSPWTDQESYASLLSWAIVSKKATKMCKRTL